MIDIRASSPLMNEVSKEFCLLISRGKERKYITGYNITGGGRAEYITGYNMKKIKYVSKKNGKGRNAS